MKLVAGVQCFVLVAGLAACNRSSESKNAENVRRLIQAQIDQGRLLMTTVIVSGTVPPGMVIAIDAADFVSVGADTPRFEVSDQATLHMEDTAPLPIVDGTPATPVRSLWQTDSLALRLILPMNWTIRRPGMVAWIDAVTW